MFSAVVVHFSGRSNCYKHIVNMEQFHIILIILSTILVTSKAAPIWEDEDLESNGEFGEHFEGDMLLTKSQREAIYEAMDPDTRNGLRDAAKLWPNRSVVYHIDEDDFDEDQVQMMEDAMAEIANKSCLTFRRREKDNEYAVVIQGTKSGCFSHVGYNSRNDDGEVQQVLNLASNCFKHGTGTVIHEMLHTLGFYHMQSTYDRDDFVTIVWENITPGHEHNFAKYSNDTVTDFGVPYDYDSIMHYTEKAFSSNGNKTIIPIKENVTIGQRHGLSESDITKLNKMYCEETEDTETPSIENNGDKVTVIDK